jgi:hypothetical protein
MGGLYVTLDEAQQYRDVVRPWWWGLVVTELRKPPVLFIDCERYPELCGEIPVPVEKFPPYVTSGIALADLLGSLDYPNPDGTGPDPDGPWGPVIRESIAALGILQLSHAIRDRAYAGELQKLAAGLVQQQAAHIQELVAHP